MLTVFTSVKTFPREELRVSGPTTPGAASPATFAATAGPTRRERARDATTAEIKATARALLVADGPDALTIRAIARTMGLTPAALYRYFAGHEELVTAMCGDVLDEITATLEIARDTVALDDPLGRLMVICRAFRTWSLAHPREFQLTFASMIDKPTVAAGTPDGDGRDSIAFGGVFLGVFAEIWAHQPFRVPTDAELPPALLEQLIEFSARTGDRLPKGVLVAYLSGWVRLYGAVTIEVFGHLGFALADPEPMFEAMLADMCRAMSTPLS